VCHSEFEGCLELRFDQSPWCCMDQPLDGSRAQLDCLLAGIFPICHHAGTVCVGFVAPYTHLGYWYHIILKLEQLLNFSACNDCLWSCFVCQFALQSYSEAAHVDISRSEALNHQQLLFSWHSHQSSI